MVAIRGKNFLPSCPMVSFIKESNPPMTTSMTFWNLPGYMSIRRVAIKPHRIRKAMTNQAYITWDGIKWFSRNDRECIV
jgi:hypothetical protein